MNIFEVFLAQIKDKILVSMSYNFQILQKFSLGHAKSWSCGREFEKILDFFFNYSHAVLFSEGQKNICWASLDVKFHKLSNCIFKNALSLFFTEISWFSQQWFLIVLTSTVRTICDGSVYHSVSGSWVYGVIH